MEWERSWDAVPFFDPGRLTDYPESLLRPLRSAACAAGDLCRVVRRQDLERLSYKSLTGFPEYVLCLPLYGGPYFVSGLAAMCYEENQLRWIILPRQWRPYPKTVPGMYTSRDCWDQTGILFVHNDPVHVLEHALRCHLQGIAWFSAWAPVSDFYHVGTLGPAVEHRYVLVQGRRAKAAACAAMLGSGRSVQERLPQLPPPHLPAALAWYEQVHPMELKIACRLLSLHLPPWRLRQLAADLPEDLHVFARFLDPGQERRQLRVYTGSHTYPRHDATTPLAGFPLTLRAVYLGTGKKEWVQLESGHKTIYLPKDQWQRRPLSSAAKVLGEPVARSADRLFKQTASWMTKHAPHLEFGYDGSQLRLAHGVICRGPEFHHYRQVSGTLRFPPLRLPPPPTNWEELDKGILWLATAAALSLSGVVSTVSISCDEPSWRVVKRLLSLWHCRPASRPYDVPYLHIGPGGLERCDRGRPIAVINYRPELCAGLVEQVLWAWMDRSIPAFPQTVEEGLEFLRFLRLVKI